MTPEELDRRFSNVVDGMKSNAMGDIMVQLGSDALLMIKNRIKDTGIDAEGTPYKPYSTKPMLAGCSNFLNQSKCPAKTKKGRKGMKWVTLDKISKSGKKIRLYEIPGGYKEFRELNDLQSGFVDFAFSNRMWANIKLIRDIEGFNKGIAVISATNPVDNDKLAGNTKRRGPILKLSKSEIKELNDTLNKQLVNLFHNR